MRLSNPSRAPIAAILVLAACGRPLGAVDDGDSGAVVPPDAGPPVCLNLEGITSASFVGDHLYVARPDGDGEALMILRVAPDGLRAVAQPEALRGAANLRESGPGRHLRLTDTPGGDRRLDLVETSQPESPTLLASLPVPGLIEDESHAVVFSVQGDHAYLCLATGDGDRYELAVAAVEGPASLGPWVRIDAGNPCRATELSPVRGVAAVGEHWVVWKETAVDIWRVGPTAANHVSGHAWAPDGIHNYGGVRHGGTDGLVSVFDLDNVSWYTLYDVAPPHQTFGRQRYGAMNLGAERALVGVVDRIAYVWTPEAVRAYDLTDIERPDLLSYSLSADVAPAIGYGASALATSDAYLAALTIERQLELIPTVSTSGPVLFEQRDPRCP